MHRIENTAMQIGDVLGDTSHYSPEDHIEFLAEEFEDATIRRVFRVAYGEWKAEGVDRKVIAKAAAQIGTFTPLNIINKALKRVGKRAIPEPERSKGEMTLELQGAKGQPIIWGKTYGDGIPIMQISFMKSDLKAAGPFLRSLGFTIVDERDDD